MSSMVPSTILFGSCLHHGCNQDMASCNQDMALQGLCDNQTSERPTTNQAGEGH